MTNEEKMNSSEAKELKPCKVKRLLNDEIVTGMLNPDGSFTDVKPLETPEYEIPSDEKVVTKIPDRKSPDYYKEIYVEDIPEEEFIHETLSVYKKVWDSNGIFYRVGYIDIYGDVILQIPNFQATDNPVYKLNNDGYPKTVEKYSTTWYRDSEPANLKANVKVSFVPSNDVYEIINTNKNESIGYISHEGKVIYWNQYRN